MRIVVNDIAASQGGALTVLKDFYSYIKENDRENEYIFLLSDNYIAETENISVITLPEIKKSRFKKLFFDFLGGRFLINALKPDRVFSLQNIITYGVRAKQTVYIHQSIPFQSIKKFSFFKKAERPFAVYQYLIGSIIKHSAKKADKIIVQTNWMRNAVAAKTGVAFEKIFACVPEKAFHDVPTAPFSPSTFFYPANDFVYKNFECVYSAADLVSKTEPDFKIELTLNTPPPQIPQISHIGELPFAELLEKYVSGTLIFSSYIETLAYPLLEARNCGGLILCSDLPFAHELLDGYENAYFFNPFNPNELAALIKKVLCGEITKKSVDFCASASQEGWDLVLKEVLL